MPGQRAPRRGDDGILFEVDRRYLCVDIDDEELANEIHVAEANGLRFQICADDLEPDEALSHDCGRRIDIRIVSNAIAQAPAIREHITVEQVGGGHAGSVVEGGAKNAIGQFLLRAVRPGPTGSRRPLPGSGSAAVFGTLTSAATATFVGCAGTRRSTIGLARIDRLTKV